MDTLWAPDYDAHWVHINPTHRSMLERFLALCPPGAMILDAACGTGKYWPLIRESGRHVLGTDQSSGMLAQARGKFPDTPTAKIAMQDLPWTELYPGAICMDALENISPEDWPTVLYHLVRALSPSGHLYFTVELESMENVRAAYLAGRELGLPLVEGEWAHQGSYHYYPTLPQVQEWSAAAGLVVVETTEGDGYSHWLTRKLP